MGFVVGMQKHYILIHFVRLEYTNPKHKALSRTLSSIHSFPPLLFRPYIEFVVIIRRINCIRFHVFIQINLKKTKKKSH